MIKASHLTKIFGLKHGSATAVDDVSLRIERGDIYGMIGMPGAGKSTLLRMLCLLEKPTSGSLDILGANVLDLHGKELAAYRKKISVVFQGYNLLMQKTVFDNVAFPLKMAGMKKSDIEKRICKLLCDVALSDKQYSYPSQLSGGQKQRTAIARVLASSPEILLCDEPTSALDPLSTKNILTLLKKINSEMGVTIIVVTHEMSAVKSICTKVAVLDQSHIIESGDTKSVISHPHCGTTRLLLGAEV